MTVRHSFHHRSRTTNRLVALVTALVVWTVVGAIVFEDSKGGAADVAWVVQMLLLAAVMVAALVAVIGSVRRRHREVGP